MRLFAVLSTESHNIGTSYVGFANVANQVFRRAAKLTFDFNLMLVGE
jgi:hypothetical protein